MNLILVAVVVGAVQLDAPAEAPQREPRWSVFVGTGLLASSVGPGAAIEGGVRLSAARHLAISLDVGYGILGSGAAQDRWWLMPSVAFTGTLGPLRVDLGAGVGLGICSGYSAWSKYWSAPFSPDWADQLGPTARVHAGVALPLTAKVQLYGRLEATTLVPVFGFRANDANVTFADRSSLDLVLGVQLGVL
jgi:hypothetical protein